MKKVKAITCYETSDYSMFKLLSFNRSINKNHVRTLVESMRKNGFTGVIQVVKTKIFGKLGYYILDGQHRVEAAKQLGLKVKFEIVELKTKEVIINFLSDLNTSSFTFTASHFLNAWADMGIREYVKIKEVINNTGFQLTPVLEAYLFCSSQKSYRKGEMTFPNEEESDKIIEQMIDTNRFLPTKAFCRRALVKVMANKKYNHKKMIPAIKDYIRLVGKFSENERDYKKELERLMENC
jgi:hypothetical protein